MPLTRRFAARMAPMAIFAGLVVAVVPPLTYRMVAKGELAEQAAIYADQVAQPLGEAITRQPYLWRYNAAKVLQATLVHRKQKDIASIEIEDCLGNVVLSSSAAGIGSGRERGVTRSVPVVVRGQAAAIVSVRIDVTSHIVAVRVITLVSVLLGLVMGLLLFFYPTRVVRRQSRDLSKANRDLEAAKDELTEVNRDLEARVDAGLRKTRQLSTRVVQIQEEERRRIARDLHDGLGQSITGLQMELELAKSQPDDADRHLTKSIETCSETLGELRRVVQEIRPPELDAGDLPQALQTYAELFERRTGLATYFRTQSAGDCSQDTALCLLRVLQEALTNVTRHAGASEVGIKLAFEADSISMEIADDGRGFAAETATDGTGLRGMGERCEFLGGSLEIESAPDQGTRILATLPRRGEPG